MLNELTFLDDYQGLAEDLALGIVVKTWGSAPRKPGSIMLLTRDGNHAGSLSGGCVEGAVITEAEALAPDSAPLSLTFDVATDDAWSVGLACGGEIQVHLQPVGPKNLKTLIEAKSRLAARQGLSLKICKTGGGLSISDPPGDQLLATEVVETEESYTIQVPAPPRILVSGAVHITEYLADFARSVGIPVDVIDPRPVFLEARSLDAAESYDYWPDELPIGLRPDRMTAVVALSHDPKIDDPLLKLALSSDCFYIGALGSKKSHQKRLTRLRADGLTDAVLDRIRGPVGLPIGAANPAEIALSIIAEITATRRGKLQV